jgi:NAD(P)H-hydrate repair Nnr-like enzyme with NAD(P)H-hydrate dehydratase domain
MLAIVGTVPDDRFPMVAAPVELDGDEITIRGMSLPVNRGTPALIGAAVRACEVLGTPLPVAYLAGDTGLGKGSRGLYKYLADNLKDTAFDVMTFHYLQPDVDWHNRVLFAIEELSLKPFLVADAGFMYSAKMSGQASSYDLFTPDVGELAFLADEEAPHPFYTRGFILHQEDQAPELIARAYTHANAASCLLVKGKKDYIAGKAGISATVSRPSEESMEAIGGTGDTLTGIVSALLDSGMEVRQAAEKAATINRLAGHYAQPTPATQISEIIERIPMAMRKVLGK